MPSMRRTTSATVVGSVSSSGVLATQMRMSTASLTHNSLSVISHTSVTATTSPDLSSAINVLAPTPTSSSASNVRISTSATQMNAFENERSSTVRENSEISDPFSLGKTICKFLVTNVTFFH